MMHVQLIQSTRPETFQKHGDYQVILTLMADTLLAHGYDLNEIAPIHWKKDNDEFNPENSYRQLTLSAKDINRPTSVGVYLNDQLIDRIRLYPTFDYTAANNLIDTVVNEPSSEYMPLMPEEIDQLYAKAGEN